VETSSFVRRKEEPLEVLMEWTFLGWVAAVGWSLALGFFMKWRLERRESDGWRELFEKHVACSENRNHP
jgi:hypothetical protein